MSTPIKTKRVIEPQTVEPVTVTAAHVPGFDYPACFPNHLVGRSMRRLSKRAGLKNLSVVVIDLPPGVWYSMRLWHSHEDELFYILSGEATLITDDGEEPMPAGSCAGFVAGEPIGHHIVNKSQGMVHMLEMAHVVPGLNVTDYPGEDMKAVWIEGRRTFVHRNGEPY